MTDLRFGTETAQSPRVMNRNLASARGEDSQRVTPVDPLGGYGACVGPTLNVEGGLARRRRRVLGERTRSETSRGLEPVYGVAPRFSRMTP
jgi:hypothetical protein